MNTPEFIFVYGTLRKGAGAYESFRLKSRTEFMGTFTIPGLMFSLGGFPGVRLNDGPEGAVIRGDLLKIKDQHLLHDLDRYEGCPHLYTRETTQVDILQNVHLHVQAEGDLVTTYIYQYNGQVHDHPVIENGDWLDHINHVRQRWSA